MTLSRWPVRSTVVANLTTGSAFKGVLWKKTGPLLIMRDVSYLQVGHDPVPMDGEIVVEREKVEYLQTLTRVV